MTLILLSTDNFAEGRAGKSVWLLLLYLYNEPGDVRLKMVDGW